MENLDELPICTRCGHAASEHHWSIFPGGATLIEECDHWDVIDCQCPGYRRPLPPIALKDDGSRGHLRTRAVESIPGLWWEMP